MWYKNASTTFFRFATITRLIDGQTDGQTDKRTNSLLVAEPHCMQCMQRGKNSTELIPPRPAASMHQKNKKSISALYTQRQVFLMN